MIVLVKVLNILFFQVPSKFLIQVPRFGREFQTYKKIVPELKLNIRELTDTYKKGNRGLALILILQCLSITLFSSSNLSFVWGGVNYPV